MSWSGACADGKASGDGVLVVTSRERIDVRYEGSMRDGMAHGEGTFTAANGDIFRGAFAKNEPEGVVVLTRPDGTQQRQTWKNGERIR